MIRPDFEVDGISYSHENVAGPGGFHVFTRYLFDIIDDDTREEAHQLGRCYTCDQVPDASRQRDTSESLFSWM